MKTRTGPEEALRCSFCHKSQDAVAKLISSPSDYPRAYICDECVAVCNSILEDDRGDATSRHHRRPPAQAAGSEELSRRLRDRPGPDQEEARRRRLQPLQAHPDEPHAQQRSRTGQVATSCSSAPPAPARRCWRTPWPRCSTCPSPLWTPPRSLKPATSAKTSRTSSSSCCRPPTAT